MTGLNKKVFLIIAVFISCAKAGEIKNKMELTVQTWAEKLGYPKGSRVVILHADDIGMCYEANQAAEKYLSENSIQSAAVMVPCPWFNEFATWAVNNTYQRMANLSLGSCFKCAGCPGAG